MISILFWDYPTCISVNLEKKLKVATLKIHYLLAWKSTYSKESILKFAKLRGSVRTKCPNPIYSPSFGLIWMLSICIVSLWPGRENKTILIWIRAQKKNFYLVTFFQSLAKMSFRHMSFRHKNVLPTQKYPSNTKCPSITKSVLSIICLLLSLCSPKGERRGP